MMPYVDDDISPDLYDNSPPPPLSGGLPNMSNNGMNMNHHNGGGGMVPVNRKDNFEPNKTLFLGDLSYFCTEDDLFTLFSPYGSINTIRVQRGVSGEPLLHGYIVFNNQSSARQALTEIDGIAFMGRNLRLQLGTVNHHNKEKLGFSDSKNFTQIHVSFICKRGRGFVVNEQVLRDIFSPFGQIADVAIKKHSRNPKQQRQTGYGFIYFVNAEDACRAVIALKNTTLHEITFDCNISHKSEHMIRSMLEPSDNSGNGGPAAAPGSLPDDNDYGASPGGGGAEPRGRYNNHNNHNNNWNNNNNNSWNNNNSNDYGDNSNNNNNNSYYNNSNRGGGGYRNNHHHNNNNNYNNNNNNSGYNNNGNNGGYYRGMNNNYNRNNNNNYNNSNYNNNYSNNHYNNNGGYNNSNNFSAGPGSVPPPVSYGGGAGVVPLGNVFAVPSDDLLLSPGVVGSGAGYAIGSGYEDFSSSSPRGYPSFQALGNGVAAPLGGYSALVAGGDSFFNNAVVDPYLNASPTLPPKRESPLEFVGRGFVDFNNDPTTSTVSPGTAAVTAGLSAPSSLLSLQDVGSGTAIGGSGNLMNSHHSLATLASLTNAAAAIEGVGAVGGSPKADILSHQPLDESLLYSFQSLSIPSEKGFVEPKKEPVQLVGIGESAPVEEVKEEKE